MDSSVEGIHTYVCPPPLFFSPTERLTLLSPRIKADIDISIMILQVLLFSVPVLSSSSSSSSRFSNPLVR